MRARHFLAGVPFKSLTALIRVLVKPIPTEEPVGTLSAGWPLTWSDAMTSLMSDWSGRLRVIGSPTFSVPSVTWPTRTGLFAPEE